MTPEDKLYKILIKLKGYMLSPEEASKEILDLVQMYPEFTQEAQEDFTQWLKQDNLEIK